MKKQQLFTGFLLIGIGSFFLLRQLSIPFIHHIYSWPTLIMLIGLVYLLYSYFSKDYKHLLPGAILLGIGVHFYGRMYYSFWIEHWAVYPFIVGTAFLLRFFKTRKGIVPGIVLTAIALFGAFSKTNYFWFNWLEGVVSFLENYWPILVIGAGIFNLYATRRVQKQKRA